MKINISSSRKMWKIPWKIILFFFMIWSMFFSSFVFAENFVQRTKCETEMLKAFSYADKLMQEQVKNYLEIPEVTAIAKSSNMGTYKRTYDCHIDAICFAVMNPNPKTVLNKRFGKCNNLKTVQDLQDEFKADFSQCSPQYLKSAELLYSRCASFAQQKSEIGKNYLSTEFIKEVQLENNSLLGAKILEIRKRMEILIKKTRKFTTHFIKVIDDIRCTLPERSGK